MMTLLIYAPERCLGKALSPLFISSCWMCVSLRSLFACGLAIFPPVIIKWNISWLDIIYAFNVSSIMICCKKWYYRCKKKIVISHGKLFSWKAKNLSITTRGEWLALIGWNF